MQGNCCRIFFSLSCVDTLFFRQLGLAQHADRVPRDSTVWGAMGQLRPTTSSAFRVASVKKDNGCAAAAMEAHTWMSSRHVVPVNPVGLETTTPLGAQVLKALHRKFVQNARSFAILACLWPRAARAMQTLSRTRHQHVAHAPVNARMDFIFQSFAVGRHLSQVRTYPKT